MKKLLMACVALGFTVATYADTVYWSEDFSSGSADHVGTTALFTNAVAVREIYIPGPKVSLASGYYAATCGKESTGAIITIPGGTIPAGSYTVSFDYTADKDKRAVLRVWEGNIGSGGTNNYLSSFLYKSGKNQNLVMAKVGDASVAALCWLQTATAGVGGISGNLSGLITVNGTDDLFVYPHNKHMVDLVTVNVVTIDNIVIANLSPTWAATNALPAVISGAPYSTDLTALSSDAESDAMTYTNMTALPAGLSLAANGVVSGTTVVADGSYPVTLRVIDAVGNQTDKEFQVLVVTDDPPVWDASTNSLPFGLQDSLYGPYNLTNNLTVTDGDPITYAYVSNHNVNGTAWLVVAVDGALGGTPTNADTGTNYITVSASDPYVTRTTVLEIFIQNINDAPEWGVPVVYKGYVSQAQTYSDTLEDMTIDIDGDALIYSKLGYTGPGDWLSIASNGDLGETGPKSIGTHAWEVEATDGTVAVTASVEIVVINGDLVFEEQFYPWGSFSMKASRRDNDIAGSGDDQTTIFVPISATTNDWVQYWSTNGFSHQVNVFNKFGTPGAISAMQYGENNGEVSALATVIPAATFTGAGFYEVTFSVVTNFGGDVGIQVFNTEVGAGGSPTNTYAIKTRAWNKGLLNTGVQSIYAGQPGAASIELRDQLNTGGAVGVKNMAFYYDGTGDIVVLIPSANTAGQAQLYVDNVRIFKMGAGSYTTWAANNAAKGYTADPTVDANGDGIPDGQNYATDVDEDGVSDATEGLQVIGSKVVIPKRRYDGSLTQVELLVDDDLLTPGDWTTNTTVSGKSPAGVGIPWQYQTNSVTVTNAQFLTLGVDVLIP